MSNITKEYVERIEITLNEIEEKLNSFKGLVIDALQLLILEEQGKITLTQEQKEATMAEYQTRKQAVVDKFEELP